MVTAPATSPACAPDCGYLRDLGVDAIWFTPWYASPLADGGYDVADYRAIDPVFGTLREAEGLIADALAIGIRTIVDVVPNHVSDRHRWFQEALAAGPGSPERARFWFRPGRGADGNEMPTGWRSNFSGTTWTRTADADGSPGEWYLHLFSAQQPDLNWDHPDVRREHEDILRFWFDRGAAGVRIDSAALLVKDASLPEEPQPPAVAPPGQHPNTDRDDLHDIYRSWRAVADSYPGTRILVGEVWLPDVSRFALYLRPDELHTAFNFDFMTQPWDARCAAGVHRPDPRGARSDRGTRHLGAVEPRCDASRDALWPGGQLVRVPGQASGCPIATSSSGVAAPVQRPCWSPHCRVPCTSTRVTSWAWTRSPTCPPTRSRTPCTSGPVASTPVEMAAACHCPGPGTAAPYGFSPDGATHPTWLRQPDHWRELTVAAQQADPGSTLRLYQDALRIRRAEPALGDGTMTWLPSADQSLAFARGDRFLCITNLSGTALPLPPDADLLLASTPISGGLLPADATAWLRPTARPHSPEGGAG